MRVRAPLQKLDTAGVLVSARSRSSTEALDERARRDRHREPRRVVRTSGRSPSRFATDDRVSALLRPALLTRTGERGRGRGRRAVVVRLRDARSDPALGSRPPGTSSRRSSRPGFASPWQGRPLRPIGLPRRKVACRHGVDHRDRCRDRGRAAVGPRRLATAGDGAAAASGRSTTARSIAPAIARKPRPTSATVRSRHDELELTPLDHARARYHRQWQSTQAMFVDDPSRRSRTPTA